VITRLLEPFTDLVRWGEPYDVEDEELLVDDASGADEPFNLWA
jgi:hypothetical protein